MQNPHPYPHPRILEIPHPIHLYNQWRLVILLLNDRPKPHIQMALLALFFIQNVESKFSESENYDKQNKILKQCFIA